MSDFISRQMAIEAIAAHLKAYTSNRSGYNMARRHMMELLAVLPAADVVERKATGTIPCPSCGGTLSEVRESKGKKYRHCYSCHFEFEVKEDT